MEVESIMEPALETFEAFNLLRKPLEIWRAARHGPPWKCLSHGTALTAAT